MRKGLCRCGFGKLGAPFQGFKGNTKGHTPKYCVLDDLWVKVPRYQAGALLRAARFKAPRELKMKGGLAAV